MRALNHYLILLSSIVVFFTISSCKKDKDEIVTTKLCEINDLEIEVGDCASDSTYRLKVSFEYTDANNDLFDVFIRNNQLIGTYELNKLPIIIDDFPRSGNREDFIMVCINDNPDCCERIEWLPPTCDSISRNCEILDLELTIGDCCPGNLDAYELTIDFEHQNAENEFFNVYVRNNELIGTYRLDQLPVTISKFPMSGNTHDFIRICINDNPNCCLIKEFESPDCSNSDCSISDLELRVGDCTCADAYNLTINFNYANSNSDFFDVYVRNNEYLGTYRLDQLPITVENFPKSGNREDFIQVVLNNAPDDCSTVAEFLSPDCDDHNDDCSIENLRVDIGDCTSDNTYNLTVNFDYSNAGNDFFDVFTRDGFYGFYRLDQLPLKLEDFKLSGRDYDYLRICINDNPDCCQEIEWQAPDCDNVSDDCNIRDLTVRVGDCTSDKTYNIWVHFEYENPSSDEFDIYTRNRKHIGTFKLDQLAIKIEDFELSGKDYDFLQICIDNDADCCEEIEWQAPDC